MASSRSLFLFCFFAFLLIGSSFASKGPGKKDTPKESTKATPPSQPVEEKVDTPAKTADPVVDTPTTKQDPPVIVENVIPPKEESKPVTPDPVVEKKEDVVPPKKSEEKPVKEDVKTEKKEEKKPSEDKSTKKTDKKTKPASKSAEESGQVGEIVEKVKTHLVEHFQSVSSTLLGLFEDSDRTTKLLKDNANKIVDKYFDIGTATWIRTNLFNIYGLVVAAFVFIFSAFLVTRIQWLFTLDTLRTFLSTLGLGVFLTLFVITSLTKDPTIAIAKNNPEIYANLRTLGITWFLVLFILNFLALFRGYITNFLLLIVSHLLLVELLGFSQHVEEFTGPLPPYAFLVGTFTLLTLLSFGMLVPSSHTHESHRREKPVAKVAARSTTPNKETSKHKKQKSQG